MTIYYTPSPVESGAFLQEVLRLCGAEGSILRTRTGKPYLACGFPKFSLTHTAGLTAAAVSGQEVGLDAEYRRPVHISAIERRLTPAEREEDFFTLWTAKEAYIKYAGTTLAACLSSLVYQKGALLLGGAPLGLCLKHFEEKGFLLCVCTAREEEIVFRQL